MQTEIIKGQTEILEIDGHTEIIEMQTEKIEGQTEILDIDGHTEIIEMQTEIIEMQTINMSNGLDFFAPLIFLDIEEMEENNSQLNEADNVECPGYYEDIDGGCYLFLQQSVAGEASWKKACDDHNHGQLISLDSEDKSKYITDHLLRTADYSGGWYCTSGSKRSADYFTWGSGENVTSADWCDTTFRPYCSHPTQYPHIWLYKDLHKIQWMTNDGSCRPICEVTPTHP